MAKILIVDDDPLVLKQLSELISSFGYEVSYVPRAEFVLDRLSSEAFDLILLDINMPGMNGFEMLTELKNHAEFAEIPVIMITGVGDESVLAECFRMGAVDYINKPVKELVLKARVNAAIKMQNYIHDIIDAKNEIIEKNEQLYLQKVKLERQEAVQSKLKQLTAQMNPHFIFNALHSIVYYISRNKIDTARGYLVDFAKLMRKTLDNSFHSYIPISDECEYLEDFLRVESIRFKDKLFYNINIEDPEILKYKIPPMLIQPYVENAIIHGIQHKEGAGNLNIHFKIFEDHIHCAIEDDGIGIAKSQALKKFKSKAHKSVGIKITNTRLELLNFIETDQFSVTIINKEDDKGLPTGTQVNVRIPKLKK